MRRRVPTLSGVTFELDKERSMARLGHRAPESPRGRESGLLRGDAAVHLITTHLIVGTSSCFEGTG
jgi:hypothetical protein